MTYLCIICYKQSLSEHAFLIHWGIKHSNLPEQQRLEALERARQPHDRPHDTNDTLAVECSIEKHPTSSH